MCTDWYETSLSHYLLLDSIRINSHQLFLMKQLRSSHVVPKQVRVAPWKLVDLFDKSVQDLESDSFFYNKY